MTLPIYQVDAFTDQLFHGNPAGVCLLDVPRPDAWLQAVAQEMNLSETAFLLPEGDGYRLRWFTPAVEVRLCGHATLSSAHILWSSGRVPASQTLRFQTLSGLLTARQEDGLIWLNFPSRPARAAEAPAGLLEALGVQPLFVGRSLEDYLVEVASEQEVLSCQPDFSALRAVPARGLILTSRPKDGRVDFVSRFFAPAVGVNEDPVTGSSHTVLAPYWADKLGKNELRAEQVSRRGGSLHLRLLSERVEIGGHAVTVLSGELAG
jgi:PhzF family phenazine biosynthesis protein